MALAVEYLAGAPEAIISFGQGCEGEPSLAAATVSAVTRQAREITGRGTINMNNNAGCVEGIKAICNADLDSIRVSLISDDVYRAYYRPRDFGLAEVRRSIAICRQQGVHVALNLLVMPGLTDRAGELEELVSLITATGVNQVQLRNLNIDPDFLWFGKIKDALIRRLGHQNAKIVHISGRKRTNSYLPKKINCIVIQLVYYSCNLAITSKGFTKEQNMPLT